MTHTDNQQLDEQLEELIQDPTASADNLTEEEPLDAATEAAIWQDKYIRLSAEFDNYRKRTLKEKIELIQSGGADVLRSVLATADDFERALAVITEGPDKEGLKLIQLNFLETLRCHGVTLMAAHGQKFNVDFHEAIAKIPSTDAHPAGTVIDVVQSGYMLNDRVLRFAKIVIAE